MTELPLLPLLLAFVAGAALAWVAAALAGGRGARETGHRLAAAEARAEGEQGRREALEARLDEALRARGELDRRLAVADERVAQAQHFIEEQKRFVEATRQEFENSFKALAAAALRGNNEQFLALAEQKLATARTRATADLEERRQSIEGLLAPLRETLSRLDEKTGELERARIENYSRLGQQLQHLAGLTATLQDRTTSLATALKGSPARGRWGEIALRNIAELAGMTAHCDFEEQATVGDGRRPDMTVKLPGERVIAVDAKAPLNAYLEAHEAADEATRRGALLRHVRDLRGHIRSLAARDYAAGIGAGVDLVVLFLPGDPFLAAAFDQDPELQVEALRSKVLLATPTTLVALLRTVAIYWQQQALAENAQRIAETARDLYERAAVFQGHLGRVGRGLRHAVCAYNDALGSFERRLLPMAARLEEMKVTEQTKRRLTTPEPVVEAPREIAVEKPG